jgi:hypothetical protein
MPTTKHSSLWLFTKSSCSSSSTWAKSITPTKIQKKLLGRGKLGYSATAEQGKKSTFRGASSGARDGTGRLLPPSPCASSITSSWTAMSAACKDPGYFPHSPRGCPPEPALYQIMVSFWVGAIVSWHVKCFFHKSI